jgi:thiamine monophosphate synthase
MTYDLCGHLDGYVIVEKDDSGEMVEIFPGVYRSLDAGIAALQDKRRGYKNQSLIDLYHALAAYDAINELHRAHGYPLFIEPIVQLASERLNIAISNCGLARKIGVENDVRAYVNLNIGKIS